MSPVRETSPGFLRGPCQHAVPDTGHGPRAPWALGSFLKVLRNRKPAQLGKLIEAVAAGPGMVLRAGMITTSLESGHL